MENKKVILNPGEHILYRKVYIGNLQTFNEPNSYSIGKSIEIPEGYQIVHFEPKAHESQNGWRRELTVDIWFMNTKRVEVEETYNDRVYISGYNEPGKVIETKQELEGPKLGLKL